MAKEYIERNALIAEYDRVHIGPAGGARKLMVDAPTADVVEVKFGEWVFDDADEYGVTYKCSRCNDLILVRNKHSHKPNYCGNCGADMRGDEK